MSDLNPYEEGLANDLAKAQARIEELENERDEALNQLDSARHSISVLEKRAKMFCDGWGEAEAKLATCKKYRDAYAECDRIGTEAVRDLEAKLAGAVAECERIGRLWHDAEAKLAKAEVIVRIVASDKWDERLGEAVDLSCEYLAELKGDT